MWTARLWLDAIKIPIHIGPLQYRLFSVLYILMIILLMQSI